VAGIFSLLVARLDWPTLYRPSRCRCVVFGDSSVSSMLLRRDSFSVSSFLEPLRRLHLWLVGRRIIKRSGETRSQLASILIYLLHLPCAHVAISICIRTDTKTCSWIKLRSIRHSCEGAIKIPYVSRDSDVHRGLSSWPVNSR
jgi:hypothetical protein